MVGKLATGTWKGAGKPPKERTLCLVKYRQEYKGKTYTGYSVIVYDPGGGWLFGMPGVEVMKWSQIIDDEEGG